MLFKCMSGISHEYLIIILIQGSKDLQIKFYWLSQEYELNRIVKELLLLLHPNEIHLVRKLEELTWLVSLRKKLKTQLFETKLKIEEL